MAFRGWSAGLLLVGIAVKTQRDLSYTSATLRIAAAGAVASLVRLLSSFHVLGVALLVLGATAVTLECASAEPFAPDREIETALSLKDQGHVTFSIANLERVLESEAVASASDDDRWSVTTELLRICLSVLDIECVGASVIQQQRSGLT